MIEYRVSNVTCTEQPRAFDWRLAPFSGEFDPKWGRPVRTFDFRVKPLVSGLKEKDFFKKTEHV